VNAVLDLLTLADHPDDTAAAFHVAHGPLGPVVGLGDDATATRRRVAERVRRRLLEEGYVAVVDGWVRRLTAHCDERQYRRLLQLVTLADAFDAMPTLRPTDFVRRVEQRAVADSAASPIQVMTVHQAKGLEYDVVVLPELEARLTGAAPPPVAVERDGTAGPIHSVCGWVNRQTRELVPALAPLFDRERTREVRESLCVLYVAMTRAVHALHVLIDPPSERRDGTVSSTVPRSSAGVVRAALADPGVPEPDRVLFAHGDATWWRSVAWPATASLSPEPPPPDTITLTGLPTTIERVLATRPAHRAAGAGHRLRDLLRREDDAARDRGTALHALFERIEWLEEAPLDDTQAMVSRVRSVAPRRGIEWARTMVTEFTTALEARAVRAVMSRGDRRRDRVRVWRERPFAAIVEDRLRQGVIDRLVVSVDEEGRAVAATVIDFKTDAVSADEAAVQAEAYRGQLEAYRDAAARLAGLDAEAVRMVLLFVTPAVAVQLTTDAFAWHAPP
jgi:ATP-dependent exoDNAse (exonuclease V) beta subunit